jgi:Arm domain-containing DNA-binding protein
VRSAAPAEVTDFRDPRVPGFVLRARPTGVHSWRVQLPDRRWVSLGRIDEVTLADGRAAAQTARTRAALGHVTPSRLQTSGTTLATFLSDRYEPWMMATYKGRTRQVSRIRCAFADLLELPLTGITAALVDRWRAERRSRRQYRAKLGERRVAGSTINRDLAALQAVLARAVSRVSWRKIRWRA